MIAFCRTYRRGQTKETTLTRLAVEDSVDTDMLKMQDRKTSEINRIMGESSHGKKSVFLRSFVLKLFLG